MIKIVILSSVAVLAVFAGYDVPAVASAPSNYGAAQGYGQAAYAPRYPSYSGYNGYYFNHHRYSSSSSSSSEEHRRKRCQPPFDLCKVSTGCVSFGLPGYSKGDKTVKIVCGDDTTALVSGNDTPIVTANGANPVEVVATCSRKGKWVANGVKFTDIKCNAAPVAGAGALARAPVAPAAAAPAAAAPAAAAPAAVSPAPAAGN